MAVTESVSTSDQHENRLFPAGHLLPFILVTALFFLWGIPNNLNDVLIRQFMKSFAISRTQAGLVQSAFYMGYFVLAMPAAMMMRKIGYKAGFVTGLCLFALGTFLFWPAAIVGRYEFFPDRIVRNRERPFISGNCLQPVYRATRRSREFGKTIKFFSGV